MRDLKWNNLIQKINQNIVWIKKYYYICIIQDIQYNSDNTHVMRDSFMMDELLDAWEETYKKGQLTFWGFLALKESNKCVEDIKDFVEKVSKGSMSCEEQSLYRTLRKFQNLAIVAYENRKVSKGPDRKYYYLTANGSLLFRRFIERNILIFSDNSIINLLNK